MAKKIGPVAGFRAVSGAMLFLSIGCGSSALVPDAAGVAPDVAAARDAAGSADHGGSSPDLAAEVPAPVDVGANDAVAAADVPSSADAGANDAVAAADVPPSADAGADRAVGAWPAWDALPYADAAAGPSTPFHPSTLVHVKLGLLFDLDRAAGSNGRGSRRIGDKILVNFGYLDDFVYLDHVGRVVRPWDPAKMGPDMVLVVSGYGHFGVPDMPPDAGYMAARALFDLLQNGPRSGDEVTGVRESPEGRVHCEVGTGTPDEATCYITGATAVFALGGSG
jgi:hypothetical protein